MDDWNKNRLREKLMHIVKQESEKIKIGDGRHSPKLKAYYRLGSQYLFLNACNRSKNRRTIAIYDMTTFDRPQQVSLTEELQSQS